METKKVLRITNNELENFFKSRVLDLLPIVEDLEYISQNRKLQRHERKKLETVKSCLVLAEQCLSLLDPKYTKIQ